MQTLGNQGVMAGRIHWSAMSPHPEAAVRGRLLMAECGYCQTPGLRSINRSAVTAADFGQRGDSATDCRNDARGKPSSVLMFALSIRPAKRTPKSLAAIVAWLFMRLRESGALIRLVALAGLGVWFILLALSGVDYETRHVTRSTLQAPQQLQRSSAP